MSYNIRVHVVNNTTATIKNIERTVWYYANGGTWIEDDQIFILNINGSGTSGTLRFMDTDTGEVFLAAVGVHNYKRWCDIITDLKDKDTSMEIHPTYYNSGTRGGMLWKQLDSIEKTSATGKKISLKYNVADGNKLSVYITIS
ncbi:lectin 2a [Lyophyllum atratum]|nr:lectin 2a [Lyophyllum atratum]